MKRTRKWEFVKQEAQRLAGLRLGAQEIADRLGVNRSTVTRWIRAGKLPMAAERASGAEVVATVSADGERKSPEEWAREVRATFDLDATDDQLVTMAESALRKANDPTRSDAVQLQAMRNFQSIVKQLALVARGAATAPAVPSEPETPKRAALRVVRRAGPDPRRALMAVSE